MIRKIIFLAAVVIVLGLSSCKTQYDILLTGNDLSAKYDGAFEYFNSKKYTKAASLFESLSIATKGTTQDDTVQYYIALSYYNMDDIYTADSNFDAFINMFPNSPFLDDAKFYRIDCLYRQTLRYELDQSPTYAAIAYIAEYMQLNPNTRHKEMCDGMLDDLNERLDKKGLESAKIYYIMEDYKSANYSLKNVLKDNAENRYREEIMYYIAMSSYKYAFNSIQSKQKERYLDFADDYYNFITEYPESKHRRELDSLNEKVQKIIKKK